MTRLHPRSDKAITFRSEIIGEAVFQGSKVPNVSGQNLFDVTMRLGNPM